METGIKLGECRNQLQDDHADDDDCQAHENRRVDERRDRLSSDGARDLRVRDVSAQYHLEATAALARHERRRVDPGEKRAVLLKGIAQGRSRLDALVYGIENGT